MLAMMAGPTGPGNSRSQSAAAPSPDRPPGQPGPRRGMTLLIEPAHNYPFGHAPGCKAESVDAAPNGGYVCGREDSRLLSVTVSPSAYVLAGRVHGCRLTTWGWPRSRTTP
jgi:hypothetical protein